MIVAYRRYVFLSNLIVKVALGEEVTHNRLKEKIEDQLRKLTVYESDDPHVCPFCGFRAKTKASLKLHIKNSHTYELDYIIRSL